MTLKIQDIVAAPDPERSKPDEKKLYYIGIGKRFRKLRKLSGYTQGEAASIMGMERTSITNMEIGNQNVTLWPLRNFCLREGLSSAVFLWLVTGNESPNMSGPVFDEDKQ